ncbi:LysE family translocator [Roseobacter ponti]|uniref:LysE family transporter n=1 Tax=Roseobacter ponti TaxID=1891787 RepID=A0A858SQJ2_9RHOB|nr:LysE family transporter [Roseobacter ponti]QJF50935.1 LysE family transporter [Roseobacter ponti]
MSPESLIAFNIVLAAAIASPGAALLYFIKTCVSAGRAAGIATGAGLGLAASLWTLAALVGLESVFFIFPWAYTGLKTAGALYLIWIAVQTWRHATSPLTETIRPRGRAFLSGLMVNAGNPKSMLFAAAVIVLVFPQGLAPGEIALIVANHLLLEIAFYTLFALLLSGASARRGYLSAKPLLDRIAATLLGALGLRLLIER